MDGRRLGLKRQMQLELNRRFSNSHSLWTEATLIDCLDLQIGSGLDSFCTKALTFGQVLGDSGPPRTPNPRKLLRGAAHQDDQPREYSEIQLEGKLDLPRVRYGA